MTSAVPDSKVAGLLDYLKLTRGFDFTAYKPPSLARRIRKRMQDVGLEDYDAYLDYLEVHPAEFTDLFNTILINVTGFFRDPPAWEYLATEILPLILAAKRPSDLIRVWSAGCASGEEPCTIAIALAERLGLEQFSQRIKIYATDVDEEALNSARQASYRPKDVEVIPPGLVEKYFEASGGRYIFHKELRRSMIFGLHDIVQDPPISRVDLLVCRNTLMYLNTEAQSRVLARFHFAINDGGVLFLGKSEMLLTYAHTFTPTDLKHRFFMKVPKDDARSRMLTMGQANPVGPANDRVEQARIYSAALDAGSGAQVVIDPSESLVLANERARELFGITEKHLARPFRESEPLFRSIELHVAIEQVFAKHRGLTLDDVKCTVASGDAMYFQVECKPLRDVKGDFLGVSVSFTDISARRSLEDHLQSSKQELETTFEELQSTNEELKATNEELQSTMEELETTNEELQSANEELETVNEEMQSTNEQLRTMNSELQQRSDELNTTNVFLESILGSIDNGVVVVDQELSILAWNHRAEDLWGLRADEVKGKNILNLDIGLPVEELRQPIRMCLAGQIAREEIVLDATNRRGKSVRCRIECFPLAGPNKSIRGSILVMEEQKGHTR